VWDGSDVRRHGTLPRLSEEDVAFDMDEVVVDEVILNEDSESEDSSDEGEGDSIGWLEEAE